MSLQMYCPNPRGLFPVSNEYFGEVPVIMVVSVSRYWSVIVHPNCTFWRILYNDIHTSIPYFCVGHPGEWAYPSVVPIALQPLAWYTTTYSHQTIQLAPLSSGQFLGVMVQSGTHVSFPMQYVPLMAHVPMVTYIQAPHHEMYASAMYYHQHVYPMPTEPMMERYPRIKHSGIWNRKNKNRCVRYHHRRN